MQPISFQKNCLHGEPSKHIKKDNIMTPITNRQPLNPLTPSLYLFSIQQLQEHIYANAIPNLEVVHRTSNTNGNNHLYIYLATIIFDFVYSITYTKCTRYLEKHEDTRKINFRSISPNQEKREKQKNQKVRTQKAKMIVQKQIEGVLNNDCLNNG